MEDNQTELFVRASELGIPMSMIAGLSIDSIKTILRYEEEAQDGPEASSTTGE